MTEPDEWDVRARTLVDTGVVFNAILREPEREEAIGHIARALRATNASARTSAKTAWLGALHNALPHDFEEPDENKIIGRVAEIVRAAVKERDQVMWSVAETMSMFEQGATADEAMKHLQGCLRLLYDTKKEN